LYILPFVKLLFYIKNNNKSIRNNAKIILLIIFLYFLIISIFFVPNSNFTKERRIYEHIPTYLVYNYICLYIFLYENFFTVLKIISSKAVPYILINMIILNKKVLDTYTYITSKSTQNFEILIK